MAVIYETTMTPGKLDLLAGWLPAQPWYVSTGRAPELARAGGLRLAAARAGVAAWIEDYNTTRPHSALNMMSPADYEQALGGGQAA
jgi:transposase InsO family protein